MTDEHKLPECGTYGRCPHCGAVLKQGFGLAGGGYGAYEYCEEHGVVAKTQEKDA